MDEERLDILSRIVNNQIDVILGKKAYAIQKENKQIMGIESSGRRGEYMVIKGEFAEAAVFTEQIEEYAVAQIRQLCDQKAFSGCRIAVMPDVHPGKVGPIGFTSTLGDAVLPAVVGIDIGCGMTMARLKKAGKVDFTRLDKVIREGVPSGSGNRRRPHRFAEAFDFSRLRCVSHINVRRAMEGLGTLGGGNHFIEVDRDADGGLCLVVHSGSRHLGKEVAEHYLKQGQKVLKEAGRDAVYELTWLEGSLMEDYLADVSVVQKYAEQNRLAMIDEILKGMKWKAEDVVSCVHNYVDFTGEEPILRKGAISARKGEPVIIPINMKDGVLVGEGLGNADWNYSAPHGAGRIGSRESVRESHTVAQFKKEMEGVYSSCIGAGTLDEAPFAYRRIADILPLLTDAVKVTDILQPVYNYKGQKEGKE